MAPLLLLSSLCEQLSRARILQLQQELISAFDDFGGLDDISIGWGGDRFTFTSLRFPDKVELSADYSGILNVSVETITKLYKEKGITPYEVTWDGSFGIYTTVFNSLTDAFYGICAYHDVNYQSLANHELFDVMSTLKQLRDY